MRFITVRELRNTPAEVWSALAAEDLVLTSNGRPRALMVRIEDDDLERALHTLRRARAQAALSRIREHAVITGAARLGPAEIEAEIKAARRARRTR
ncbi:MAG: type II toxin-antitoxin system Phd/YefM family antitoxin [Deltaproteobacteria bacterium]|nr:type II toxin-antitoxin system Phd/YefM family antitoxin [Deltaproteobacteria bacterium]